MLADQIAAASGPVRFEKMELWRAAIPMLEPFRISSGEVANKEALFLRVNDGDAFGWGESSAMPGGFYSADTPDSCQEELEGSLCPELAGRGFPSMAALDAWLDEHAGSRFARVAVETAAWEVLARRRGVGVGELFRIAPRPVPSGLAVGLYPTLDGLRAALDRYRARNYCRVKIKIQRGQDVEQVAAVRRWLGDFPLFVDANADYGDADFAVFEDLDSFGLMMFEQPLGKDALELSAEWQRRLRTPICLDESADSLAQVRRAIQLGACRIVNIKLQRVGGYLEALRMVEECQAHGIALWMGTMPELGVGSAQALALAAHPAFTLPTDVEPSARWYSGDVLAPELVLRDGMLHAPPGPGLAFAVDTAALERWTVARQVFA